MKKDLKLYDKITNEFVIKKKRKRKTFINIKIEIFNIFIICICNFKSVNVK